MGKLIFILLLAFSAGMSNTQKTLSSFSSSSAATFHGGVAAASYSGIVQKTRILSMVPVYCYNQTSGYFTINLYNNNTSENYYFNTGSGDYIGSVPEGVYSVFVYPPIIGDYYDFDMCTPPMLGQYADFYNVSINATNGCNYINIDY